MLSSQLLSFKLEARIFAGKRLSHVLNRSLSAINSFLRKYRDPAVKMDNCAQYVDDISIAAHIAEQLFRNSISAHSKCMFKIFFEKTKVWPKYNESF